MKEQILIFGLGHIGGSIAKSLCKQGIRVYAEDLSKKTITYAIKNKIIKGTFSEFRPFQNPIQLFSQLLQLLPIN